MTPEKVVTGRRKGRDGRDRGDIVLTDKKRALCRRRLDVPGRRIEVRKVG